MASSIRTQFLFVLIFAVVFATCLPVVAQQPGNSGGAGGSKPTAPTSTPTTRPSGTNFPNTQTERQILYITGSVVLQDGTPPPEPVAIERMCGGSAHKEGYTDSKGHYQIQLGQNLEIQDVSESSGSISGLGGNRSGMGARGPGMGGVNPRDLMGCDLRAMLPGFQSSSVMI